MSALMISTQMGKPAFVARLIPVYSLTAEFLFDQVSKLIEIIHENSGFVYMAMNDNLRANQKMFSIFHKTYKPRSLFSIAHPIPNDTIDELFLLYDPTHLLKNIRNNWCTEKLQKLKYTDHKTKEVSIACWKDLIQLYNCEYESIVK